MVSGGGGKLKGLLFVEGAAGSYLTSPVYHHFYL